MPILSEISISISMRVCVQAYEWKYFLLSSFSGYSFNKNIDQHKRIFPMTKGFGEIKIFAY